MRFLRSLLFNLIYILWSFGLATAMLPMLLLPRRYGVWISTLWAYVMFKLLPLIGIRVEIRGKEHIAKTPVIYASKHQSALDILVLLVVLPQPAYILKKELLYLPLYGLFLTHTGMIAIDRKKGASSLKHILKQSALTLSRNRPIIIFPEGTRVGVHEKKEYQPGVAAIYNHLKVPVVPVALNTGLLWAKNALVKTPGVAVVEFLPPIQPGMRARDFMKTLETTIETESTKLLANPLPPA